MADSNITKNALASALKELMEHEPFSKISVGDICDACGMNRKSFYYHFRDKYDLVNWIFDTEFIAAASRQKFSSEWELLGAICNYLYKERSFYCHALQITGQNSFSDYFRQKLRPILMEFTKEDICKLEHADFFLDLFSDASLSVLLRWLSEGTSYYPPDQFLIQLRRVLFSLSEKLIEGVKQEKTNWNLSKQEKALWSGSRK